MQKHTYLNRTATLAIAATVAFSSTPLLAQDAPVADAPDAVTTAEPVAAEPAAESVATDPHAGHSADQAPAASAPAPKLRAKAKASEPIAKADPARAESVAVAPLPSPLAQPIAPPLGELIAATVESATAAPNDDLERAAFAGILALLALGGAATAVSRRRRAHAAPDRPLLHETARSSPPPVMPAMREPARRAPSAFAWGRTPTVAPPVANAGGSWVERARRGPTPDNPSLSLKKRAAFYEQRERAVAAGRAEPLVPQAGLPERAIENFRQGRTSQPAYTRALQPA